MRNVDGIVNIYKPVGITSHDVIYKVRKILGIKKVGHTGTLDPEACGVLPVCVGKGTKLAGFITDANKEYKAVIRLGITTDTQDATGKVLSQTTPQVTVEKFESAVKSLVGEIYQLPPMYSAIKINGKKLYTLARKGVEVEREPRKINIYDIQISGFDGETAELLIKCSKGTYIRTICHDIGQILGCGAIMQSLERTASGQFKSSESVTLEKFAEEPEKYIIPPEQLLRCYKAYHADERQTVKFLNGCTVPADGVEIGEIYRVYSHKNEFLCLSVGVNPDNPCLKLKTAFF